MNIKLKNGMEVEISPAELAELNKNNISLESLFVNSTPKMVESKKPVEKIVEIPRDKFSSDVVKQHYNIKTIPSDVYNREYYSFKQHKKYTWEMEKPEKKPLVSVQYKGFKLDMVEKHLGHKVPFNSEEYRKEFNHFRMKGYYSWESPCFKRKKCVEFELPSFHGFDKKLVDKHFGKTLDSNSSEYKKEHNFFYRHGRYSWEPSPEEQMAKVESKPATNMPFKQNMNLTFIGFDKKVFLKHKGLPASTVIDNDEELKKEYCTEQGFYNKHGYYSWFKGIDLDYYTWRRKNKEYHKQFQSTQETNPNVFKYYNNALMMCNIVNGKINGNTVQRKVLNAKYMNAWFKANEPLLTNPKAKLQEHFVYDNAEKIFKPAK